MNLNQLDYRVTFYEVVNDGPEAGMNEQKKYTVVSLECTNQHKKMYS